MTVAQWFDAWTPTLLTIAAITFSLLVPHVAAKVKVVKARLELPAAAPVKNFKELCNEDWVSVRRVVVVDQMHRKIDKVEKWRRWTFIAALFLVTIGLVVGFLGIMLERTTLPSEQAKIFKTVGFFYLIAFASVLSTAFYFYAWLLEDESVDIKKTYGKKAS